MSWNNVLPWWVIELEHEHFLASAACAFDSEWFAGTSRALPDYLVSTAKATFASWKFGGWNYDYTPDEIADLQQLHRTTTATQSEDW
jgi:hypothetical protein